MCCRSMRRTTSCLATCALVLGVTTWLHGQVIPIDDFDHMDSSLPGWTTLDLSNGQPWGPGSYDPSSGALRISHPGSALVPPGTPFAESAMFAFWDDSTDPIYQNGYLRAKIRTNEPQNSTAIEMRLDLSTVNGYVLFGFTQPPTSLPQYDGVFLMSKFVNGVETNIWNSGNDGIEYLVGEDWNVEFGTVGNKISAKVWKDGDSEPSSPQFLMIDDTPITGGQISISSDRTTSNTTDARGDGTFDDIYFIVPEPGSLWLFTLGFLGVLRDGDNGHQRRMFS